MNQEKIETLDNLGNVNPSEIKDLPTTSFKSIDDVQKHQEELLNQYQSTSKDENGSTNLDLSSTVAQLEAKLKKKRLAMPFTLVVFIVLLVNAAWYAGVKLVIEPKYESYVEQSEEIKKNYDVLKSRVDAIVGE